MPKIVLTTRVGTEQAVDATAGLTLMEAIRDSGDLLALCGGMCSCATCHVFVERDLMSLLPPVSEDEHDLLAGSGYRQKSSRLSCQIHLTDSMEGLRVTVAPEE